MKKHLKVGILGISALLSLGVLSSCNKNDKDADTEEGEHDGDVEVATITTTESTINMFVGDTHKVTVTILPENATNKNVTFESNKPNIASVSSDGTITANAMGLAVITVTSSNGKKANIAVTVNERQAEEVKPTEITVDKTSYELIVGEEKTISYGVLPENATNKNVEFQSSNRLIATVSQEGVVKAIAVGDATITVRSSADNTVFKQISITVKTNIIDVTDITLTKNSVSLHPGETETIQYEVLPENATDKSVLFTVKEGGENVCTVSPEGVISATAVGDAIIYVQSKQNGNQIKEIAVHVENAYVAVESLTVGTTTISLHPTETSQISASVSPDNATLKALNYASANIDVASVDSSGLVTAISVGTTVITVSSADNSNIKKEITINVTEVVVPVTGVVLTAESLDIKIGEMSEYQIVASVEPENASNKSLEYTSDNANVATVSATGLVSIKGVAGVANITIKSLANTSITKTFKLTVSEIFVTGIELECEDSPVTSLNFTADQIGKVTKKITAVLTPENPTDASIIWVSSKTDVATVGKDGVISPVGIGTTTITAKNVRSGVSASLNVTVVPVDVTDLKVTLDNDDVTEISVSSEEIGTTKSLVATVLPENATDKKVVWSSNNQSIATVLNGVVTFTGIGSTKIKVASNYNPDIYKEIDITVSEKLVSTIELRVNDNNIDSLTFSEDDIGVAEKKVTVAAVVTPATAFDTSISWTTLDENVAKVSDEGVVTPIGVGNTTLIAKNLKSGVTQEIPVHVVAVNHYELDLPVHRNASFVTYDANRAEKTNKNEEFNIRTDSYKVGCDNRVNLLPVLNVYSKDSGEPVAQDNWAFDFEINIEKEVSAGVYEEASSEDFKILSLRTCEVKFNDSTVGNKYRVSILPGGQDEFIFDDQDRIDATATYEFEIVRGYNIYRAEELGYFDTTTADTYNKNDFAYMFSGETTGKAQMPRTVIDWPAFKKDHNLDPNVSYDNLVLHDNLNITDNDIPSEFFYSEAEGYFFENNQERDKSIGSFKDYCYAYVHHGKNSVSLQGNYFTIDYSAISLITRPFGKQETTGENANKLDSHSAFMKSTNGDTEFRNLNIIGNAHNAKTTEEEKYAGGLFFFKASDNADEVKINNVLTHSMYITLMSELPTADGRRTLEGPVSIKISDLKAFDNYNCFIYNWGGELIVDKSYFEGCGGPVLIQDHTGVETDPAEFGTTTLPITHDEFINDGKEFKINGFAPYTEFNDCVFNNYVMGEEAWFKSFEGAVSAATQVKQLSDVLTSAAQLLGQAIPDFPLAGFIKANVGGTLTPMPYQMAAANKYDAEMNFIVLNKSGSMQSITTVPVDGNVKFTNNGEIVDQFNYFNPTNGSATFDSEKETYEHFRTVQSNALMSGQGMPVVETKGGKVAVYPHDNTADVYDIDNVATLNLENLNYDWTNPANSFLTVTGQYVAIYYNGMMLVMELFRF